LEKNGGAVEEEIIPKKKKESLPDGQTGGHTVLKIKSSFSITSVQFTYIVVFVRMINILNT
jgi:hypothetical protein